MFALVLGLLAWIFLAAVGVVIGSEINVVRAKRLYPRALLTPFTDNVDLTEADRRAYLDAVNAQQFKGFQIGDGALRGRRPTSVGPTCARAVVAPAGRSGRDTPPADPHEGGSGAEEPDPPRRRLRRSSG